MMESKELKQPNLDKVFVYGTLQSGHSRNYILSGLKFEKATLMSFRKVEPPDLGFPFIVRDINSEVPGEIYYKVSNSLISQLDLIEGEGKLYHRVIVKVLLDSGKELKAFTYYPSEILIKNYL
ncbi:MAG: gamma-glutamylcyclotransferase [Promethearchaeota archaeon]